jgi:uncharacterized protein (DUF2235 family)
VKRIIICCDGTWNRPDQLDEGVPAPTNVLRLYDAIRPDGHDGVQQLRFYEQGVGTHGWLDRFTGGALGIGLAHNVRAAYETIVDHYEDGDELYLFGFSRGAYTARSLAGLIRNSGIVRDPAMIGAADALYRRRDDASKPAAPEAEEFRRRHSWSPRIHFIGVWDTVGALGIPGKLNFIARRRFSFHDVELSSWVDHACQALAIDEQRKPLLRETRPVWPCEPGHPQRSDDAYERNGTAYLFMVFEPLGGQRHVKVTARRTKIDFAHVVRELVNEHYHAADCTSRNLCSHRLPHAMPRSLP